MQYFRIFLVLAAILIASRLDAQTIGGGSDYVIVPVTYQGTVTSSATQHLQIRLPDGQTIPYTGPAPDYPFNAGDPISISFDAIVPSPSAIANGYVPPAVDGIYTFQIGPRPEQLPQFPNTASFVNFSGNGGITQWQDGSGNASYGTNGGLAIVYNANTDSYALNTGFRPGPFGIGFFDFPMLAYDLISNSLSTQLLSDRNVTSGAAISGTSPTNARIPISIIGNDGSNSWFAGGFDLAFDGGWSVGSRTPVDVPEPSMLLLFGAGAGALTWRRKRALAAQ